MLASTLLALTLSATVAVGQSTAKIAYLDSQKILDGTPGRTAIGAQLEKEMAPLNARMKAINDSNAAMLQKYQADAVSLSADAKATRQKEIGEKQRSWQQQVDSLNSIADSRRTELEGPMIELLKKIINEIRQEDGYWIVFDIAGQGGANIVAIDKNLDISERVLTRYKLAAVALPKPGAPGTPPAGPVNSTTGVGRIIPPRM
jgi:outer membrane protein